MRIIRPLFSPPAKTVMLLAALYLRALAKLSLFLI
jgi:hypothetical protein